MEKPWNEMRVYKTVFAQDNGLAISVLDPDESKLPVFSNLVAFKGEKLIWRVSPPGNPDYFVDLEIRGGYLFAYTYSGFRLRLSIHDGKIIDTIFVK